MVTGAGTGAAANNLERATAACVTGTLLSCECYWSNGGSATRFIVQFEADTGINRDCECTGIDTISDINPGGFIAQAICT